MKKIYYTKNKSVIDSSKVMETNSRKHSSHSKGPSKLSLSIVMQFACTYVTNAKGDYTGSLN